MAAAPGRQRAEHGQQQSQVLHHHGRVLDAAAQEGACCDLDQRHQQHQPQRPARNARRWVKTSSKVAAGTIVPRMRGYSRSASWSHSRI